MQLKMRVKMMSSGTFSVSPSMVIFLNSLELFMPERLAMLSR